MITISSYISHIAKSLSFQFEIKTLGPKLPQYLKCSPECGYLGKNGNQKDTCILFQKPLNKTDDQYNRTKECISAVEGLI